MIPGLPRTESTTERTMEMRKLKRTNIQYSLRRARPEKVA
jgi:hypothetical protein